MKNMLVFGSILAASAATFACGDSTGDGGSGGATTQASTAPATGSGSGSTKASTGTGTGASTSNTTASASGSGSSGSGASTSGSTGSGGMCAPVGDPCQDCIFMNCCDELTACQADAACQTCMDCLQTTGAACLFNGMCDAGDPTQGAFINCGMTCQAQCQ